MDKKPPANSEAGYPNKVVARPNDIFRPVPLAVLDDPDLIIGSPRRVRGSYSRPLSKSVRNELTQPQKVVRRAIMAGRAAIEYGGTVPDRVRDDLFALAQAGDGAAICVAKWLVRKRLAGPLVLALDLDNRTGSGGDNDR